MTVELYTLPNCGICHMVKTKLQIKDIPFIEKNFGEIAPDINSDRAPVLKIEKDEKITFYDTPTAIVDWINQYGA